VQLFEELVDELAVSAQATSSGKDNSSRRRHHKTRRAAEPHQGEEEASFISDANDPMPPDLLSVQLQFLPDEVKYDSLPRGVSFGDLVEDVNSSEVIVAGSANVRATWWGANPRADLRRGGTFLTVERAASTASSSSSSSDWVVVATDADFATKFIFERPSKTSPHESHVSVEWAVPTDAAPGTYRLHYFGDATPRYTPGPVSFEGLSSPFTVVASAVHPFLSA